MFEGTNDDLADLPAGDYGFLEFYCDEPGCDCRRVMFYVVSPNSKGPLAVIVYGWENVSFYKKWFRGDDPEVKQELKGPALNTLSPQSKLAPELLKLVKNVLLKDFRYVERLERHYRRFRAAVHQEHLRNKGFQWADPFSRKL